MSVKIVTGRKEIKDLLRKLRRMRVGFKIKAGKKHHFLVKDGKKIPIPSTPSDPNSHKQFKRDIEDIFLIEVRNK